MPRQAILSCWAKALSIKTLSGRSITLCLFCFLPWASPSLNVSTSNFSVSNTHIHWRQLVLVLEILLLLVVGFLPTRLNLLANAMVSFSCAMQVQSFRKEISLNTPLPVLCASATSEAAQMPYVLLSVPVIKTLCANPCATGESFYSLPSVQVSAVTALQFSACEPYGFLYASSDRGFLMMFIKENRQNIWNRWHFK